MRIITLLVFQLYLINLSSQTPEVPEIADPFEKAISEFHKPFEHQDYAVAVSLLEDLKRKYPDSTEIRYFLGYAYDRLNSKDGKSIPDIDPALTLSASKEFEFIIDKEPKYTKRKLVLDPYSKITSLWGSLAFKYYYNESVDSMSYALQEGKKRGGFNDAYLEIAKNILKSCSENAILFASGDNFSFPILYVQQLMGYRKDVQVIDLSLLNTDWYCSLLKNTSTKNFLKDSIDYNSFPRYAESSKQVITIPITNCTSNNNEFKWKIDKLRNDLYLIKSDSILKEIVIKNGFQSDIYFTVGQFNKDLLSLNIYFSKGILLDRLNPCTGEDDRIVENQMNVTSFDSLNSDFAKNSDDLLRTIDLLRYTCLAVVDNKINELDFDAARQVLEYMEKKLSNESAPIQNEKLKEYIAYFEAKVKR